MNKIIGRLSDLELLRIMKEQGIKLCQEAREKWAYGKYSPISEETKQNMLQRWYSNEARIKELHKLFREYLKSVQEEGVSV
jgi:hypothetical protein